MLLCGIPEWSSKGFFFFFFITKLNSKEIYYWQKKQESKHIIRYEMSYGIVLNYFYVYLYVFVMQSFGMHLISLQVHKYPSKCKLHLSLII